MFEIGFSEILVIVGLALLVLGPEKLPKLASQIGRWTGRARSMARQLRTQLEQEVDLEETLRASARKKQPQSTPASMDASTSASTPVSPHAPADLSSEPPYGAEDSAPQHPATEDDAANYSHHPASGDVEFTDVASGAENAGMAHPTPPLPESVPSPSKS